MSSDRRLQLKKNPHPSPLPAYRESDRSTWQTPCIASNLLAMSDSIGAIAPGYLADIVGRRVVWIAAGLLTALYLPILIYIATPGNVAYLLLLFGLLYGISIHFMMNFVVIPMSAIGEPSSGSSATPGGSDPSTMPTVKFSTLSHSSGSNPSIA